MGKEELFEKKLAEQKQILITDRLATFLSPGVAVETAAETLDMDLERLLSHMEAVTEEGQSPWLKGNVLALRMLWQQEDVGLAICDERELRQHFAVSPNTPKLSVNWYYPPREFGIQDKREIPYNALSGVVLGNAAFTIASGIGKFAQNEPFDDVAVQLLTGCSREVMGYLPRFIAECGFAEAVPQDMMRGYRIKGINPKYFGADIPQQ